MEDFDAIVMPLSLYIETGNGRMMRSITRIETEVNEALAVIYYGVTNLYGKELDKDYAQFELCHTAGDIYHSFKEVAIEEFGITGNPAIWELIEQLTDKCVACFEAPDI